MRRLIKTIKPVISFTLNRNPIIPKTKVNSRRFIPEPYKGVVLISADFELAWAWRYSKSLGANKQSCLEKAQRERSNVTEILALCDRYNIPITWAIVGHLLLNSCSKTNKMSHPEIKRVPYFENRWWKYTDGDWFDDDPCSDFENAPEWYCPDLVQVILAAKVKHEVACHTFSHIPCSDEICSPDVLESELIACKNAADNLNLKLESFVFPGHTMGNFEVIRKNDYTSVRTNYKNILGYPKLDKNGLWQHETTMELNYNPLWPRWYNLYRFKRIIKLTMKRNAVCNLWLHPSCDYENLNSLFPSVFNILNENRYKLWITTMREYTDWLNSKINKNP